MGGSTGRRKLKLTMAETKTTSQTKYRNFIQFVHGVGLVRELKLSPLDRLALNCLAAHTDFHSGIARPGEERIAAWCGCYPRSVRRTLRRLWDRELIARASVGTGGRGLAAEWRILVEDPRFPDPKPGPNKDRVSSNKPGPWSPGFDGQNPVREMPKPGPQSTETRSSVTENPVPPVPPSYRTLTTNLNTEPIRAAAPQDGARGRLTLSVLVDRLKTVFAEQTGQLPTWRQADVNAIARLVRERADLDAEEFATRYEHFLTSELPFHRAQGGSPRFFERHFDSFIEAVETDGRLAREKRTFRNLGLPHSGDRRSPAAVPRPKGKEYPKPKRYEV